MTNKYLNEFFTLKCAPDILSITGPVASMPKELTEAMAVRRLIKNIVLYKDPMQYVHIDFCSGNALGPILSVFTLPIKQSIAVDNKPRNRQYNKIKRFSYWNLSVYDSFFNSCFLENNKVIITAIHACGGLSERVVEIYNQLNVEEKYLILMPCCIRQAVKNQVPIVIKEKLGAYLVWVNHLYNLVDSECKNILIDENIISPCNALITATNKRE